MQAIHVAIAAMMTMCMISSAVAVECAPSRGHTGKYWAYRVIDGRTCWYEGQRGKSKALLHWPEPIKPPPSPKPALRPIAAPAGWPAPIEGPWQPIEADEDAMRAWADDGPQFTERWPIVVTIAPQRPPEPSSNWWMWLVPFGLGAIAYVTMNLNRHEPEPPPMRLVLPPWLKQDRRETGYDEGRT